MKPVEFREEFAGRPLSRKDAVSSGVGTPTGGVPDHAPMHQDGGTDEINIASLSGTPAALTTHEADTSTHGVAQIAGVVDAIKWALVLGV